MANHCEKLVKKLIEKIFKIPISNTNTSTQVKSSKNILKKSNININIIYNQLIYLKKIKKKLQM